MTHEKLQALKDQLERINPKSDPLVYRRQEQLIRQAQQELAVDEAGLTLGDLVRKHANVKGA